MLLVNTKSTGKWFFPGGAIEKGEKTEESTVVHVEVDAGRKHRDEFNKDVLLYIDGQILPTVNRFIRHVPSEESKLIQATDLFAWGIAQKYRQGKSEWYDTFKHKIQDERIIRVSQQQK